MATASCVTTCLEAAETASSLPVSGGPVGGTVGGANCSGTFAASVGGIDVSESVVELSETTGGVDGGAFQF